MAIVEDVIDLDDDHIHNWFGLSYSNYLVLPRSILQSMSAEWQKKFVGLLDEMEEKMNEYKIPLQPDYQVTARNNGKYVKDIYSDYWRNGQRCFGLVDVFGDDFKEKVNEVSGSL